MRVPEAPRPDPLARRVGTRPGVTMIETRARSRGRCAWTRPIPRNAPGPVATRRRRDESRRGRLAADRRNARGSIGAGCRPGSPSDGHHYFSSCGFALRAGLISRRSLRRLAGMPRHETGVAPPHRDERKAAGLTAVLLELVFRSKRVRRQYPVRGFEPACWGRFGRP
jgi:hypothetical protein